MCFVLLFSGCTKVDPVQKDAEKAITDGIKNLIGVGSYSFELGLDGSFDALQGEELSKFTIDGQFLGKIDSKDSLNPKISISIFGTGALDSASPETLSGELRFNKENLYFKIANLPNLGGEAIPQELLDTFVGKWWQVPIPEDTYTEDNPLLELSEQDEEKVKELKGLLDEHVMFKDLEYAGEESVKGELSSKYSGKLDKDSLKGFIIDSREVSDNPATDEEVAELEKMLNSLTFEGFLYVGQESQKLNKIAGDLYIKDDTDEQVKEGEFALSFVLWDFDKPVSLDIPENAELFNPFMLLGAPEMSLPVAE